MDLPPNSIFSSMDKARVLAVGGTAASVLSMTGGWISPWCPRLGPVLVGAGGAVMLSANLIVALRR